MTFFDALAWLAIVVFALRQVALVLAGFVWTNELSQYKQTLKVQNAKQEIWGQVVAKSVINSILLTVAILWLVFGA